MSLPIAIVCLNQMPTSRRRRSLTRANPAETKFMAVVMALAGSLKVKGSVVPRTIEAPILEITFSGNNKTKKHLKKKN